MANFVLVYDPDTERRNIFLSNIQITTKYFVKPFLKLSQGIYMETEMPDFSYQAGLTQEQLEGTSKRKVSMQWR
ncbi:MAG: hypothetical protein A3G23_13350 [Bacteroidetes bacterium RIFCSPLOWO2_12_FULL_37_12]|nr:MAG: hypothetical protein A3G23_13350 [Bacteroidetes bacterium RIFCSPLOWO2_12_FULL_37_12]